MPTRNNTLLLKRSNVLNKIPTLSDLKLGELAINVADVKLYSPYTGGATGATEVREIGWNRVARTGDTMTGSLFTPSLSATTISATTYLNLPIDVFVTGGTYDNPTGTALFTNNTGGTFSVTGFTTGNTDTFTTGFTYSNNVFTISRNQGQPDLVALINTMTGLTVNGNLTVTGNTSVRGFTATTASATTLNIPSSGINIFNPANTFFYTLTGGAITANRILNIPVITTTDTLVVTTLAQTLSNKTLTSPVINTQITGNIVNGTITTTNRILGETATQTGTNKTFSASTNTHIGATHLRATPISTLAPTNGQILSFSGTSWVPTSITDIYVTGGTYNAGTATFTNNTGGTFNVTGFTTTDTFTTGFTYSNNVFTIARNQGQPDLVALINTMTGLTINGNLTVTGDTNLGSLTSTTISATTYQNLPIDVRVTGGTYNNTTGIATFTNNSGGTFDVTGFTNSNGGGGGATGKLFYFNLSVSQSPYQEISEIPTSQPEQSSGVTINIGDTSTISSFLTPANSPNITSIPAGIWSFFLHSYKENINASFDIFCEVYKRTSGGSETLLFSSDPEPVTSNSPNPSMQISDVFYSGTSLDISDRILVKVRATNTSNQSHMITFVTEGTSHYSYFKTSFGSLFDTYVTGFTYSNNVLTIKQNQGQPDLSALIDTMTGLTVNGNLTVTGSTTSGSLSATTISGGNLTVSGVTFSKLLLEKVGIVSGSGFTGNPKKITVTFNNNFPDTNYGIFLTGPVSRTFTYESQSISGFTINANANAAFIGNVYWMAKQIGEV